MPWVALLTITALLFGWILDAQPPDLWPIWWVVAGAALIFGAGGYAAHFGSDHPAHWATLSAAGGLAGFGFAYFAHKVVGGPAVHWGFVALGLGVPYLLGAVRAASPAVRGRLGEEHLAALCVAVTTLVSLAVPLELERHWIAVAWALEAAALAWLLWKLGVRVLGYLSLALGAGAVVRLLLNPMVLSYPVGDLPVFNWFLYGYGLPALAFAGACLWMERARWGRWAQSFGWGSGAFVFALLTLEVRQGFHPGGLMGPPPTLVEWATYSHLWLLAAVALLAAYRRSERSLLAYLGVAFLVVSAGKICLVDAFAANPLWNPTDVGSLPVLNWLLYVYGLPALAFWLSGRLLDSESDEGTPPAGFLHAIALGLAFLLLTLEIRQVFHPGVMSRGSFSLAENAVITCAWLLMAAAMTYANRNVGSGVLRWGARLLLGLSAAKLLLVDVLALNPLWWHRDVGELPVLNLLLLAYVLPAALLWVAALAGGDPVLREHGRRVAFGGSLVLGFVWLSLGVRQFFHPRFLDAGPLSNAENYSYSAAWILFALMLLAIGIARRGRVVRVASLVVIFLAVSKVFLFDLRHLQDLYRVMSFLGLGVSLFLIAILYQRFVFSGAEHES
jgi:uncharacterized membrane protein